MTAVGGFVVWLLVATSLSSPVVDPKLPAMTDRFRGMRCRPWLTRWSTPSAILLRNATPSVFHDIHIGRML